MRTSRSRAALCRVGRDGYLLRPRRDHCVTGHLQCGHSTQFRPASMRASRLLAAGASLDEVSAALCHSSPSESSLSVMLALDLGGIAVARPAEKGNLWCSRVQVGRPTLTPHRPWCDSPCLARTHPARSVWDRPSRTADERDEVPWARCSTATRRGHGYVRPLSPVRGIARCRVSATEFTPRTQRDQTAHASPAITSTCTPLGNAALSKRLILLGIRTSPDLPAHAASGSVLSSVDQSGSARTDLDRDATCFPRHRRR